MLWSAADQLRANSNLTAAQYSQPGLGRATLGLKHGRRVAARRTVSVNQTRSTKLKLSSPTRKALARVKRAALTLTVSAPDAKPVTRNVTLTRG